MRAEREGLGDPEGYWATVTDDVSGPAESTVYGDADTSTVGTKQVTVTGHDNAGVAGSRLTTEPYDRGRRTRDDLETNEVTYAVGVSH